ncbi:MULTISPECIES: RNA polymerase sigma-70 factor [unclassified Mucilaginibacter]|uniref:RNA polymerase sigma-70 factor n=1 Tax=unclassified Mucilaginibacter TaxID=2617802 RepID=UPI00138DAC21|nr:MULTISPECIES: RNA polymerase sigma-70 factor [unclassified Mucilaginibacter]MBB5394703.1 RNA polymerase sigma-70 factor (ECF subfamily) [Mucilaginibacter sp. AK015]QHS56915.1 RNA polymerase sigma-70 factor [Mucilaginibacter sp. 14171R-50]
MLPQKEYQMWPDAELLNLLRLDDRKAFETLYKKYSAKVYQAAYNLFRDKAICEDLVQELFIDLWTKRHKLNISSLEWYLKVAIKNRVLMYLRTQRATLDLSAIAMLTEKYTTDSRLLQGDISNILENNVERLPEKCRQIFTLSRKEYLSNKEIASRLNISVKTVENQMTIALRYLRTGLGDYLPMIVAALIILAQS